LRCHELVRSPLWSCEPYLIFAHHLLARADAFAGDYNGALADYRGRNGIKTTARPMPDLQVGDGEIEVPFWLDDLSAESRRRGVVKRQGGALSIEAPAGELFALDAAADGDDAAA